MSTVTMRVWREIRDAYKGVADKANILLSDLVSLVLLYAGLETWLIVYILQEEFELEFEEACECAEMLLNKLVEKQKEYAEVKASAEEE